MIKSIDWFKNSAFLEKANPMSPIIVNF